MVTFEVFHFPIGWLKAVAHSNILLRSVTSEISQELRSWLNDLAPENMSFMLVTEETSHFPIGWLKEEAPLNMRCILVTREVSQELMS